MTQWSIPAHQLHMLSADFAAVQGRVSVQPLIVIGDGIAGETRTPACSAVEELQRAEREL